MESRSRRKNDNDAHRPGMADRLRFCCGSPVPFELVLGRGEFVATSRIGRSIMIGEYGLPARS